MIAASNCDLRVEVVAGRFRGDLYHRLNVTTLAVPPLRSRLDDIAPLARHFAARYSREHERPEPTFTSQEIRKLLAHDWPGNVRELENYVKRRVLFGEDELLTPDQNTLSRVESGFEAAAPSSLFFVSPLPAKSWRDWRNLTDEEKLERLTIALASCGGNVTAAAKELGISRRGLQKARRRLKDRNKQARTSRP